MNIKALLVSPHSYNILPCTPAVSLAWVIVYFGLAMKLGRDFYLKGKSLGLKNLKVNYQFTQKKKKSKVQTVQFIV